MTAAKAIFFLGILYFQNSFSQPFKADTSCCTLIKETAASNALKKSLLPFLFFIKLGDFDKCAELIKKSKQLQADSFACCVTSKYLILDAETILAMTKNDFKVLVPLTTEILNLVDETEARYRSTSKASDQKVYCLMRLIALEKRYLGYVHTLSGDELDKLDVVIDSLRPLAAGEQSPYEIPYLLSKAYYHQSFKDYKTASQCIETVFELQRKTGEGPLSIAAAFNAMALLYFEKDANDKVVLYCDSGLSVLTAMPKDNLYYPVRATMQLPLLINKGNALLKLGKFDRADTVFEEAQDLFKNFNDPTNWIGARLLHNRGTCRLFMGRYGTAFSEISEANQKYIKYLLYYFGSLDEDDKYRLMGTVEEAFNALPVLLNRMPEPYREEIIRQIYDEQLTIKMLIVKSERLLRAALLEEKDSVSTALYNKMTTASDKLLKGLDQNKGWNTKEMMLNEKNKREYQEQLYQHSGVFKKIIDQLSTNNKQVQQSLACGETAIELIQYKEIDWDKRTWSGSKQYVALVINYGDTIVRYVKLCTEADIVRLFKKAGADKNTDRISMLCFQPGSNRKGNPHLDDSLSQYILQPLIPYLKGTKTIYFSSVGLLNRIPIQAISYERKGPLINYFDVRTLLTTGSLVSHELNNYKMPATAALWYDIDYGNPTSQKHIDPGGWLGFLKKHLHIKLDRLSAGLLSQSLVRWLNDVRIKTSIFQKTEATEIAFKHLDTKEAEIIHIETHGFSIPVSSPQYIPTADNYYTWQTRHPMFFSGLFLAGSRYTWQGYHAAGTMENNILTAYELAQMDLRKTLLVVLGACETGLGQINENEGVYGLGRALKIAGADKIILTLWHIPDEPSQVMFKSFYEFWLKEKLPIGAAFSAAQRKVYEKYHLPYFWAGFVLIE